MNKTYYDIMLKKGRLMPFIVGDRLGGFATFFICNDGEEQKYLREDMWSVEEDNPNGNLCWVDQLWTDKNSENYKVFYRGWIGFRNYIKRTFPNVKYIRWNRYNKKTNQLKEFKTCI